MNLKKEFKKKFSEIGSFKVLGTPDEVSDWWLTQLSGQKKELTREIRGIKKRITASGFKYEKVFNEALEDAAGIVEGENEK